MNTIGKMNNDDKKREVPPALQKILLMDVKVTKQFVNAALKTTALRSLRNHSVILEWSCHGVAWLALWFIFIWCGNKPEFYQLQVNVLFALILDIVIVGVVKAFVRRRRPSTNNDLSQLGPDKFSFPSGHATRAVLLAFVFLYISPVHFIFYMPILAWTVSVCLSRILLEKHYILDVVGGIGIGLFEGLFMALFWLSQGTSAWFLSMLTDEKLDGGEYHV